MPKRREREPEKPKEPKKKPVKKFVMSEMTVKELERLEVELERKINNLVSILGSKTGAANIKEYEKGLGVYNKQLADLQSYLVRRRETEEREKRLKGSPYRSVIDRVIEEHGLDRNSETRTHLLQLGEQEPFLKKTLRFITLKKNPRIQALRKLWFQKDRRALPVIAEVLKKDPSVAVREKAAKRIGEIRGYAIDPKSDRASAFLKDKILIFKGEKKVEQEIITALNEKLVDKNENNRVKLEIVKTMGLIGAPEFLPALADVLLKKAKNPVLWNSALESFEELTYNVLWKKYDLDPEKLSLGDLSRAHKSFVYFALISNEKSILALTRAFEKPDVKLREMLRLDETKNLSLPEFVKALEISRYIGVKSAQT